MKTNQEKNIIISEGQRPFWQVLIAGLCYTVAVSLAIFVVFIMYSNFNEQAAKSCFGIFSFALTAFMFGLRFSLVNNIYFDLDKTLYKKEYAVGMVRVGKWEHLPNIEYICIFKQGWIKDTDGDGMSDDKGHKYDVNVWHDRSKHFTIYSNFDRKPSFEFGKHIAMKLGVDFLDASNPQDKKWVELEAEILT